MEDIPLLKRTSIFWLHFTSNKKPQITLPSVVKLILLVPHHVPPPFHHLPVQGLHDLPHPALQRPPLAVLLQHRQLIPHHSTDPLFGVRVLGVVAQGLTALYDELLLNFKPVAQLVELRPALLQVLVHDGLGQAVVDGGDDVHIVGEGLFVFGEVDWVEFVGLQEHVEDEHLEDDHHGQHELLQGFVGPYAAQVLRYADGFHLEGRPETTHHETTAAADVQQDL